MVDFWDIFEYNINGKAGGILLVWLTPKIR